MKRYTLLFTAALVLACAFAPADAAKRKARPSVDVVFVLDTTGSMGGLIEGAKLKIWSIANQIVGGSPTPDLRVVWSATGTAATTTSPGYSISRAIWTVCTPT